MDHALAWDWPRNASQFKKPLTAKAWTPWIVISSVWGEKGGGGVNRGVKGNADLFNGAGGSTGFHLELNFKAFYKYS